MKRVNRLADLSLRTLLLTGTALCMLTAMFPAGVRAQVMTVGAGNGDATVPGGTLDGTTSLLKVGTGTVTLDGGNSYTGGTTVTGGTLAIASAPAVNDAGTTAGLSLAGGTLRTSAGLTLAERVFLGAGGGTIDTVGNDATLTGAIDNAPFNPASGFGFGTGPLVKLGSGTLTLGGTNIYTGGTIIGGGVLAIAAPGNINDAQTSGTLVLDGGTLRTVQSMTLSEAVMVTGNGGTIDTAGNTLAYGGDLGSSGGAGTFTKAGAGTLLLTGVSDYNGTAEVAGGTLAVGDAAHAGASLAGSVTVDTGATLAGHGTIGGAVSNNGTVRPGSSTGTLAINGSYSQGAAGTYAVDINPQVSSALAIGGAATLGGTLAIFPEAGTYATGTRYSVLGAAGGVSGTFATMTDSSDHVFFLAQYLPSQVVLTSVVPDMSGLDMAGGSLGAGSSGSITSLADVRQAVALGFSQGSLTPNEQNVANAITAIIPGTGAGMLAGLLPVVAAGNAAQRAALDGLGGELRADIATIELANLTSFGNFVTERMSRRQGVSGGQEVNSGLPGTFDIAMNDTDLPLFGGGTFTTDQPTLWFHGYGVLGEAGGETGFADFQYQTGGIVAGVDATVAPGTLVGAALNYEHTDFNLSGAGDGGNSIDTYRLALYGSQALDPVPLVLDGAVSYGLNQFRDDEADFVPGVANDTQDSRHAGHQFSAQAGLSHGFDINQTVVDGQLRLAPRVGVAYDNIDQNQYTTTGAAVDGLNLHVNGDTLNALRSTVGGVATLALVTDGGTVVTPEVRASYLHDFMDTNQPLTEAFTGAAAAGFRISGVHPGRDAALAGAGVTAAFSRFVSAGIQYDAALRDHELDHTVQVAVKLHW